MLSRLWNPFGRSSVTPSKRSLTSSKLSSSTHSSPGASIHTAAAAESKVVLEFSITSDAALMDSLHKASGGRVTINSLPHIVIPSLDHSLVDIGDFTESETFGKAQLTGDADTVNKDLQRSDSLSPNDILIITPPPGTPINPYPKTSIYADVDPFMTSSFDDLPTAYDSTDNAIPSKAYVDQHKGVMVPRVTAKKSEELAPVGGKTLFAPHLAIYRELLAALKTAFEARDVAKGLQLASGNINGVIADSGMGYRAFGDLTGGIEKLKLLLCSLQIHAQTIQGLAQTDDTISLEGLVWTLKEMIQTIEPSSISPARKSTQVRQGFHDLPPFRQDRLGVSLDKHANIVERTTNLLLSTMYSLLLELVQEIGNVTTDNSFAFRCDMVKSAILRPLAPFAPVQMHKYAGGGAIYRRQVYSDYQTAVIAAGEDIDKAKHDWSEADNRLVGVLWGQMQNAVAPQVLQVAKERATAMQGLGNASKKLMEYA